MQQIDINTALQAWYDLIAEQPNSHDVFYTNKFFVEKGVLVVRNRSGQVLATWTGNDWIRGVNRGSTKS